ncbi:SRPBCC domain-containing protein [uncultured Roseovarius sp.]|uniref:SRPBCC family protein n=1 Tax=uncultured Roseovarius sp. TaxID=293344 RepID=UPI0026374DDB|nr:SRPBCC domain-containing protein [uncultured Roseovarius sp.]
MTVTDTDLSLTVTRTIAAPPERVFDAWLDPEMLMRFMQPGPGMTTPQATTDAKIGGRFDLIMKKDDDEMPHGGVYKVIDRPNRIVFSWESPFSVDGSTVTLDFRPEGDGTHVTLTHIRFPNEESRDNHEGGWTAILARLAEIA